VTIRDFLAATLLSLAFAGPVAALDLQGDLVPGGFATGQVEPGARVLLGDQLVMIGPDGMFVIRIRHAVMPPG